LPETTVGLRGADSASASTPDTHSRAASTHDAHLIRSRDGPMRVDNGCARCDLNLFDHSVELCASLRRGATTVAPMASARGKKSGASAKREPLRNSRRGEG